MARGDGSIWKSVVSEVELRRCAFNSHSAAFGIGRLFSLMPSKSSSVLPMPPAFPLRAFGIKPIAEISFNFAMRAGFV